MIAALIAAGGLIAGGAAMARPMCLPTKYLTAPGRSLGVTVVIPARNAATGGPVLRCSGTDVVVGPGLTDSRLKSRSAALVRALCDVAD